MVWCGWFFEGTGFLSFSGTGCTCERIRNAQTTALGMGNVVLVCTRGMYYARYQILQSFFLFSFVFFVLFFSKFSPQKHEERSSKNRDFYEPKRNIRMPPQMQSPSPHLSLPEQPLQNFALTFVSEIGPDTSYCTSV